MSKISRSTLLLLLHFFYSTRSEENVTIPSEWGDYGTDWVMFPGDNGTLHYVNLSDTTFNGNLRSYADVKFFLYTRNNVDDKEEVFIDDDNEYDSPPTNFTKNAPIKVLSPGWMSSGESETVIDMKNAFLSTSDVNVVIVDWRYISHDVTYFGAAQLTRHVGKEVAKMVKTLLRQQNMTSSSVHMIGHSLGAHVMGFGGSWLKKWNLTVARVTGLDPARPSFEDPLERLKSSDADFVDIIHSDSGFLGLEEPIGIADFYPNGGKYQPGCEGIILYTKHTCCHARSHQFFTESIKIEGFLSKECSSYDAYNQGNCNGNDVVNMGVQCPNTAKGSYFLHTESSSPYSKNE